MARKAQPPVRPDAAAGAIMGALEPLAYGRPAYQVFDDWLAMTEASLMMLPAHARSVVEGNGYAQDPEWVQGLWARLREVYMVEEWQHLHRAFNLLVSSTADPTGEVVFHDTLGEVFMEFGAPNDWAGQFFTPFPVALMMAQMTLDPLAIEAEVRARVRRALFATEGGEVLYIAWLMALVRSHDDGLKAYTLFAEQIYPQIYATFQPYRISDPACGSGVLLVATLAVLPAWLTQWGLVEFHATDIDSRCVRMAHTNLMLYGAASYVVRHQNSLSLEPDFAPPHVGRVHWYAFPDAPSVADPMLATVMEMAGDPVADPLPEPRPAAPPLAPVPDVVLDITKLTQLMLDL